MGGMKRRWLPDAIVCGGRFRVLCVLAVGGMGSVYEVEDVALGRHYVLKTLHVELASQGDLRRQMQVEARVLGGIDHLNIVRVFTAGVSDEDLPFILMEKLDGASLRDVLRTGTKLGTRAAVHMVIDLLLALDHVHEMGVVHCDVKPENIFLHSERGQVVPKLLDFGVVRVLSQGEAAFVGGTVRYASPEQVRGEVVGPRSDVYSMGLVLYEMLAGCGPFRDARSAAEIAVAQTTRTPARIAGVPSGLMDILLRALAKDTHRRPRDAFAFARELRDIEPFLGGDASLAHAVIAARAANDEVTKRRERDEPRDDTLRDATMCVSSGELVREAPFSLTRRVTAREAAAFAMDSSRTVVAASPRAPPTRDTR